MIKLQRALQDGSYKRMLQEDDVSELFGRKKEAPKHMTSADKLEQAYKLMTNKSECFSEGNGLSYVIWGLNDDPFDGELYKLGRAFVARLGQVANELRSQEDASLTAQEDSLMESTLNALAEEFYNSLSEESKSKAQQKFMGMVNKCQKEGDCASPEVEKVAGNMKKKDVKDFAGTKHKGLPNKVPKKENN